jgi:chromosome segregation ATPase
LSLDRATPPPAEAKKKPNGAPDKDAAKEDSKEPAPELKRQDSDSVTNLQQTVSLLIAERTDLQTGVASLKKDLSSAKADAALLSEARDVTSRLEEEKKQLEGKVSEGEKKAKAAAEIKSLLEKVRGELAAAKKETEEAVAAKEAAEDETEELKGKEGERVAELEKNLERAQAHEGVLEAEIGRLKQVRLTL